MLQFFDLCGDDHGAGAGDEDDCTDGDHGVDEIVIKNFQQSSEGVGRNNPNYRLKPAVAHELGRTFPRGIQFFQAVFHHQIGG